MLHHHHILAICLHHRKKNIFGKDKQKDKSVYKIFLHTHYVFANFEEILKRYATAQTKYAAFFSFGMLMRIIIWFILSQGFEDEGSKRRRWCLAKDVFGLIVNKKESDHNSDILASFILFTIKTHSVSKWKCFVVLNIIINI